jgi:hypothetical protein
MKFGGWGGDWDPTVGAGAVRRRGAVKAMGNMRAGRKKCSARKKEGGHDFGRVTDGREEDG